MGGIFDVDSAVTSILNKITNTLVLNVCFLISCLPVITAGAAVTALYSVNLKMVRNEESYVCRTYWKSFKENFKQSTLCWLLMLVIGLVFGLDFLVVKNVKGTGGKILMTAVIILFVMYGIVLMYVFPYMARFQDKLGVSIKNALMIGGGNPGYTITLLFISAACAAITFVSLEVFLRAVFVWIVVGFSLLSYFNSFFFRRLFEKYEVDGD